MDREPKRTMESKPKQEAIAVSGFSEIERVREAQKPGAGAYVIKPYTCLHPVSCVKKISTELTKAQSNIREKPRRKVSNP